MKTGEVFSLSYQYKKNHLHSSIGGGQVGISPKTNLSLLNFSKSAGVHCGKMIIPEVLAGSVDCFLICSVICFCSSILLFCDRLRNGFEGAALDPMFCVVWVGVGCWK